MEKRRKKGRKGGYGMLRGIAFYLAPEMAESQDVKELLNELGKKEIRYVFCPPHDVFSSTDASKTSPFMTSFAALQRSLTLPVEDCLVLTDSAAGIASAKAAGVPCIGYASSVSTEDMSGAYALFEDFASIDAAYLSRTHAHAVGYPADILSTNRLLVREFSPADFPALYAMCTEPSTASFMEEVLSDYNTEQEKHNAYLRNIYPFFDLALWGIYERTSSTLIGRAGFSLPADASDTFSLGYLIDVPYRRQGIAKELIPALLTYAKEQGYQKISARIKQNNIASVKVLEQCGFPYECKEDTDKGILTYIIYLIL